MTAPPARPHLLPRPSTHFSIKKRSTSSLTGDWGWSEDLVDDDAWDSTSDHEDNPRHPQRLSANRTGSSIKPKRSASSMSPTMSPGSSILRTPSSSASTLPAVSPIPFNGRRTTLMSSSMLQASSSNSTGSQSLLEHSHSSSSTASGGHLSFSYTHVQAPSPSSYPTGAPIHEHENELNSEAADPGPSIAKEAPPSEQKPAAGWTIVRTERAESRKPARVEDRSGRLENLVDPGNQAEGREPLTEHDADVDGDMVLGEMEFDSDALGPSMKRPRRSGDAIRLDAEDVLKDPLCTVRKAVQWRAPAVTTKEPDSGTAFLNRTKSVQARDKRDRKLEKCQDTLLKDDINIKTLRDLSWHGVPPSLRYIVWPILLGYFPLSSSARLPVLQRKREEYASLVELTFARGKDGLDQQIWHQIEIDVPRTRPGVRLWMERGTQKSLERILYVWAIRHPASGYVQGINDLVTPFYQIFLSAYIDCDPEDFDPGVLPPHIISAIEADSFWCLSRLLDGIQDNYIHSQPGIQRSVKRMKELVARIDPPLAAHLEAQGVEFMQFAFRWMNCLLMREISVKNTIRMWDTYLSESSDAFSQFHLYVCSAFLVKWSEKLREMDFQGIIMFLQSLPTQSWTDHEIELLLSEAFVLNSTWANAQSHFSGNG